MLPSCPQALGTCRSGPCALLQVAFPLLGLLSFSWSAVVTLSVSWVCVEVGVWIEIRSLNGGGQDGNWGGIAEGTVG